MSQVKIIQLEAQQSNQYRRSLILLVNLLFLGEDCVKSRDIMTKFGSLIC